MATYLGYVSGGKTTKAEAELQARKESAAKAGLLGRELEEDEIIQPTRDHTQFHVQRELAALGVDSWVGRKIDFMRRGKNRTPEAIESPALPNYIFMELTPEQFMLAKDVKYLASTFAMVPNGEIAGLDRFKSAVEASFSAAQRVDANSRASVSEYKRGASLSVVAGPFADMLVRFERLVKSPDVDWPRVEVTVEGMGGKVQLDPLDVRRAG